MYGEDDIVDLVSSCECPPTQVRYLISILQIPRLRLRMHARRMVSTVHLVSERC